MSTYHWVNQVDLDVLVVSRHGHFWLSATFLVGLFALLWHELNCASHISSVEVELGLLGQNASEYIYGTVWNFVSKVTRTYLESSEHWL